MSVTSGFFNSSNSDRKYNAEQMSQLFDGIITDGVFSTYGEILAVAPSSGRTIVVKTGRAWFDGTWTLNDAWLPLTLSAAHSTLKRIDAIVLEVNKATGTRKNSIKIVKGSAASSPSKPTLTNSSTVKQHPLAYITLTAGMTTVTASAIDIRVGKSDCPFATGLLQQANIDDLFANWGNQFDTWFANVQAQLSGNVATNLQNQITQNKNALANKVNTADHATQAEAEAGTSTTKWMSPARVKQLISAQYGPVCKIATGSYTGTGTYGSSNPCSITLDFKPELLIVGGSNDIAPNESGGSSFRYAKLILVRGSSAHSHYLSYSSSYRMFALVESSMSDNAVNYSSTFDEGKQFNAANCTYPWICFGILNE